MKKFFLAILIFFSLFGLSYACAIPPDILNRFYIYEENNEVKIEYTLNTWLDFTDTIKKDFVEKTWQELKTENLQTYVNEYIKKSTTITYNWEKLDLNFESWEVYDKLKDNTVLIKIVFWTKIKNLWENNLFYLNYKKDIFWKLTHFSHSFFFSEIEEKNDMWTYKDFWDKRYLIYYLKNWEYWIISETLKEEDNFIEYILDIKKIWTKQVETKSSEKTIKNNPLLTANNKNSIQINWVNIWAYFQEYLWKDVSVFVKIFWLFFAIIFWALHWLLPGHSKSIVWAYMMEKKSESDRNKEVFILITTITLTHTIFIFLLAFAITLLKLGTWTSTNYLHKFSLILYIFFWIYFCLYAYKKIKNKNISACSCWCSHNHNHEHNHNHGHNQKANFKKTLVTWIIFWCNPCIDALVLFLLSFSIWDTLYASFIVVFFSLWLGLMLGILALLTWKWYNILANKKNNFIEKFLNYLVFAMWVFIIFYWIKWLI